MKKSYIISFMYGRLLAVLLLVLPCFVVNARIIDGKPVTPTILLHDDNYKRSQGLSNMEGGEKIDLPLGIKFALNISNMNFNKGYPKPSIPVESSWKTGFSGGAFLEISIISNLALQQEYLYTYLRSESQTKKRSII